MAALLRHVLRVRGPNEASTAPTSTALIADRDLADVIILASLAVVGHNAPVGAKPLACTQTRDGHGA